MKFKRIVPVHVEEQTQVSRTVCDFCKKEIRQIRQPRHDASEVRIEACLGNVFPEGDFLQREEFDCCASCWREKVGPALTALAGAPPRKHDNEDFYEGMPVDQP